MGVIEKPVELARAIMALGIRLKDAHAIVSQVTAANPNDFIIVSVKSGIEVKALNGFRGLGVMVLMMARSPVENDHSVTSSTAFIHQDIWHLEDKKNLKYVEIYN